MSERNLKRNDILNLWAAGNCAAEIGRKVDLARSIVEGIVRRARATGDNRAAAVSAAERAARIARGYTTKPLTARGKAAIGAGNSERADKRIHALVTEAERVQIIAMLQHGITMVDVRRQTGRGVNTVERIRNMARRSGELHPHVLPYLPINAAVCIQQCTDAHKPSGALNSVGALARLPTLRLNMSDAEERQVASYLQQKPQTLRMEALRIVRGDMARRATERKGVRI